MRYFFFHYLSFLKDRTSQRNLKALLRLLMVLATLITFLGFNCQVQFLI